MPLTGCFQIWKKPVETKVVTLYNLCPDSPTATPIIQRPIKLDVIILQDNPYVAMDIDSYENLSKMMSETIVHIEQKNSIITYYKECIATNNKNN